jgi:hypothetical protein
MSEKKEKQSSWLVNIFMLITGAISIMLGVTNYVFMALPTPSWWPFTGPATGVFSMLLGGLPIGVWMLIGAIGLWKEKAWALGTALVCFTIILANGLIGVIQLLIIDPIGFWLIWACWVALIMVAFSAIGFIYLVVTNKRYH